MSADPIEPIGKVNGSGVAHEEHLKWAASTEDALRTSSDAPPRDASQLSPLAQFVATLERLRSSDPAKYAEVTQKVAKILDGNAQTALSQGNPAAARQLNQLSSDFSSASKSDNLNSLLHDLSEAAGSGEQPTTHTRSVLAVLETSSSRSAQSTALNSVEILVQAVSISGPAASKKPPV